jgi:prolipoprotein diacylglyceryltransferase
MKAFWRYTLARLSVLAVTYLLLWGIGRTFLEFDELTNLLVLLAAMVISSVISIFLLAGMREQVALQLQERAERMTSRIEESRSAEDVD